MQDEVKFSELHEPGVKLSIPLTYRSNVAYILGAQVRFTFRVYAYRSFCAPVLISAGTSTILAKVFRGIPQSVQENVWIVS
jgi:hypothetical protein